MITMAITITTRIDDKIVELIDKIAREEGMDRSTVLRRFLIKSANEWLMDKNLKDYEQGKITLWKAARNCGLPLWEIVQEARDRKIYIPYDLEDFTKDIEEF